MEYKEFIENKTDYINFSIYKYGKEGIEHIDYEKSVPEIRYCMEVIVEGKVIDSIDKKYDIDDIINDIKYFSEKYDKLSWQLSDDDSLVANYAVDMSWLLYMGISVTQLFIITQTPLFGTYYLFNSLTGYNKIKFDKIHTLVNYLNCLFTKNDKTIYINFCGNNDVKKDFNDSNII